MSLLIHPQPHTHAHIAITYNLLIILTKESSSIRVLRIEHGTQSWIVNGKSATTLEKNQYICILGPLTLRL